MQIFKKDTTFDFMGKRRLAAILSTALIIISLVSIVTRGLNLGVDFTGGTLVEISSPQPVDLDAVRDVMQKADFDSAMVQYFGSAHEVLIRLAPREDLSSAEISTKVLETLKSDYPNEVEMRRIEFVGPQVGDELTEDGGLAMLYALFGILVYVAIRFEKRFAAGSVIALVHDVIITIGVFSLLGMEFDLSVLAAILAVIGYSLNDTIVVFDRIRENFRKMRKGTAEQILNVSINQTISRTLITSLTTLLVLLALFFLGGEIIHGFAFALIIGVIVGTYSSIYIAGSSVLAMGVSKADLMPVVKEGQKIDDRP
ncbi:MAG TPA: protein translocase subunit SecF [Gammaproteobacteria bacterium]|nr:protein translocase subunit SecF [Gammaproteobacteria bacterium]